jgi:saccharopine dehydrogenase-like NADP-dependent oxidoreductase
MKKHTVFVAGAGGIGPAVSLLLREYSEYQVDLFLGDIKSKALETARAFLLSGSANQVGKVELIQMLKNELSHKLDKALASCDLILDCLPGEYAPRMAELALKYDCHYANLTEYVEETKQIEKIAEKAEKGFILQTGLAPGFINILARSLFEDFIAEFGVKEVDAISMKVGALSNPPIPPHYYGFTWNTAGVATEYIKDAVVIRDGKKDVRRSLTERGIVVIDGIAYEEALTSGGAADLPDALAGKVRTLDYKTLRHRGHYEWVEKVLDEIQVDNESEKAKALDAKMIETIPQVEDDFVLVYASVQGKDSKGDLQLKEKSYRIEPREFNGKRLKAIQSSTAGPLAQCAQMLLNGKYHGIVHQSQIDTKEFLRGDYVSLVYKDQ